MFMAKILSDPVGWPYLSELLIDFFTFVAPWLKDAQMNPAIHLLYQGMMIVILNFFLLFSSLFLSLFSFILLYKKFKVN
jgi:hypothetical protein